MLILSRHPRQKITIGDNITVEIMKIDGNTVQVGIEAPKSVPILRDNAIVRVPKEKSTEVDATAKVDVTEEIDATVESVTL